MPRRYADYPVDAGWTELNVLSTIGALIIGVSVLVFLAAVVEALRRPRHAGRPVGGELARVGDQLATAAPQLPVRPRVRSERPVFDARVGGPIDDPRAPDEGATPGLAVDRPPADGRRPPRPARRPAHRDRFFAFLGVFGLVLAVIYWFVSYEVAGTVLLFGFACTLGAARLLVVRRTLRPAGGGDGRRAGARPAVPR